MKIILLACLAFSIQFSIAQNWTGAVSSDWNNSSNWSAWPLNGQDLTIDPTNYTGVAASPVIATNSVFSPAAILVSNGGILTVSANLTTSDDVECIGIGSSIIVNSGTFSVNPGDGGRFIIDLGASCEVNGGNLAVDERLIAGENTLITINGGTASSGERLLMDGGGQFVQEGGTVSTAAVFAMADGSTLQNSGYTFNNGNLNITGEFAIECEAGNFEPFFIQNGGVLTVNGDMFWLGVTPGTGRGSFIQNSGTSNINGIIQNMPASTTGMHFELNNDAICNITGTLFENLHATDSLVLTGTSQLNITQPTFNLLNSGVVDGVSGTVSIDGACTATGTGSFQFPNVNVLSNSVLTHTTASPIAINGDVLLDGNYLHQNHELELNGNTLQTISGASTLSAFDLTIDNTDQGVMLATEISVEGLLDLMTGIVHTSTTDILTLSETATSTSGNAGSFVSGPMDKIGNAPFVFPVGKNAKWARLGISAPGTVTDVFRAEYFDNAFTSLSPVNSPLSGVSGLEYWNLEQITGTSSVQVELYWEDAAASTITDCNELSIARWDGGAWENELSTTSGSCVGNSSGAIESNTAVGAVGTITFGFYSGVTSQQFDICNGESVMVGTSIYTTSGTYIDVLQDVNNNDSVVVSTVNVTTINPDIQFVEPALVATDQTAATYTWIDCYSSTPISGANTSSFTPSQDGWYAMVAETNGCADTSNCVYYNFIDTIVCQGETIAIGSTSYGNQGVYFDVLTATNALDSIVKLELTVNLVDTSIALVNDELVSSNVTATSFQWFDCNANAVIPNENGSTFSYTSNGSYSLIVEENGCVDTSACITISDVGLNDINPLEIVLYPNPTEGQIGFEGINFEVTMEVLTMTGQRVFFGEISNNQVIQLNVEKGSYLIRVFDNEGLLFQDRLIVL